MRTYFENLTKTFEVEGACQNTFIIVECEGGFDLDFEGNETSTFSAKMKISLHIDCHEEADIIKRSIDDYDTMVENLLCEGWEMIRKSAKPVSVFGSTRILTSTFDKAIKLI